MALGANGFIPPLNLLACGVAIIIISSRSPFMSSSSSSSLLVVSESSMFTLETELEIVVRSAGPEVENSPMPLDVAVPRRWGIVMPRPPIVGEESGEASARVEWWRFVQAREKSRPLERLGNTDAGEP
jgi:hypothetical protein